MRSPFNNNVRVGAITVTFGPWVLWEKWGLWSWWGLWKWWVKKLNRVGSEAVSLFREWLVRNQTCASLEYSLVNFVQTSARQFYVTSYMQTDRCNFLICYDFIKAPSFENRKMEIRWVFNDIARHLIKL